MKPLPDLDLDLHRTPNEKALGEVLDLGRSREWATILQIRCGVADQHDRTCGRKVPQRVVATPRGPLAWGDLSSGFHDKSSWNNTPSREHKASSGRDWGAGGVLYGLLDEFPPPPNWWWASCDRGHDAVVLLELLRKDVRARKRVHLTAPAAINFEGSPFLL